ncbi:MAG: xanthine dehydrogenase accessory protein XdhC, partial [Hyphomicrobiaceae bacterium]|nr:xanthine dehydrogenase accessory protein XdhC [Hyphomicrobiaceae bacterium]
MSWIASIERQLIQHDAIVRVTVIRAEGSTPRETGAAMLVGVNHIVNTIGGGALELAAIGHARAILGRLAMSESTSLSWQRDVLDLALGPSLGQCCGGHARLLFEAFTAGERHALEALARTADPTALVARPTESGGELQIICSRKEHGGRPLPVTRALREMLAGTRPRAPLLIRGTKGEGSWFVEPLARAIVPLFIYGAGHVGRALVRVVQDLPFRITWADTATQRFPDAVPPYVSAHASPDLPALAAAAPGAAFHIVMTYSHALDLAICHAVLRRGEFGHLGLIGSATKRARFLKRLAELGISPAMLQRLTC